MKTPHILVVTTSHGDIEGRPTTGIWFTEFTEPFAIFREAGFSITTASPRGGPAPIDPRGYPSREVIADVRDGLEALNATLRLAIMDVANFDGLFFPGGHGPMFDLVTDPICKSLISAFWEQGKPVAAMCHGVAALLDVPVADGGTLLAGRRTTGFSTVEDAMDSLFRFMPFSLEERMRAEGSRFVSGPDHQSHVKVDGQLVTGQNAQSAVATAEAFRDLVNLRKL